MISAFIEAVSSVITGVISWITAAFSGVIDLVWDSTATTPHITTLGLLLLIGFGVSIVFFAMKRVLGLFGARRR